MTQIIGTFQSISQVQDQFLNSSVKTPELETSNFQEVLRQKADERQVHTQGELKFSKHANQRLASRNISLTRDQVERLQEGVLQAREKGIQESLVLLDNLSFIVNVKNDTVVTALDQGSDAKKIFTNIDGAVIV